MARLRCPPQTAVTSGGLLWSQGPCCPTHLQHTGPGAFVVLRPQPSWRHSHGQFPLHQQTPNLTASHHCSLIKATHPHLGHLRCLASALQRLCPSSAQALHGRPVLTRALGPAPLWWVRLCPPKICVHPGPPVGSCLEVGSLQVDQAKDCTHSRAGVPSAARSSCRQNGTCGTQAT